MIGRSGCKSIIPLIGLKSPKSLRGGNNGITAIINVNDQDKYNRFFFTERGHDK
jgi:hypothetical protein